MERGCFPPSPADKSASQGGKLARDNVTGHLILLIPLFSREPAAASSRVLVLTQQSVPCSGFSPEKHPPPRYLPPRNHSSASSVSTHCVPDTRVALLSLVVLEVRNSCLLCTSEESAGLEGLGNSPVSHPSSLLSWHPSLQAQPLSQTLDTSPVAQE